LNLKISIIFHHWSDTRVNLNESLRTKKKKSYSIKHVFITFLHKFNVTYTSNLLFSIQFISQIKIITQEQVNYYSLNIECVSVFSFKNHWKMLPDTDQNMNSILKLKITHLLKYNVKPVSNYDLQSSENKSDSKCYSYQKNKKSVRLHQKCYFFRDH
jgi:hypothetical protein